MKKILAIITLLATLPLLTHAETTPAGGLATKLSGKILIQVQSHGEAWYVNPVDKKRYPLGRPENAYDLMKKFGIGEGKKISLKQRSDAALIIKKFGLGITNQNLETIPIGVLYNEVIKTPAPALPRPTEEEFSGDPISAAANAIRKGDKNGVVRYFTPQMKKAIEYTMNFLDAEGRLTLGNILSGSRLEKSTETKKVYLNEVYFNGEKIPVRFNVEKINGVWLMTNL